MFALFGFDFGFRMGGVDDFITWVPSREAALEMMNKPSKDGRKLPDAYQLTDPSLKKVGLWTRDHDGKVVEVDPRDYEF